MATTVHTPRSLVSEIGARHRTITVFLPPDESTVGSDVEAHFATRNVSVETHHLSGGRTGFVVVESEDGSTRTVPLTAIAELLSGQPTTPRAGSSSQETLRGIVGLDELSFRSFDRSQMLYTTREIEERAYRLGSGSLHVGFQRAGAFDAQHDVYEALLARGVGITAYVADTYPASRDVLGHDRLTYHVESVADLADYWFLVYDGAGDPLQRCALVAEERAPGRYYGVWTYDPELVAGFLTYLRSTY
jgi:hypothetical protein